MGKFSLGVNNFINCYITCIDKSWVNCSKIVIKGKCILKKKDAYSSHVGD